MRRLIRTIYAAHKTARAKRRWYQMLWRFVGLGVAAYSTVCLASCVGQSKLVYFPMREIEHTPKDYLLDFEEVTLEPAPGAAVNAWYVPAKNARGTVLFCHGNGGNISHRLDSIEIFNRLGMNVFIFDYRGYGNSSGRPGEKRTYEDAAAAWDYLVTTRGEPPDGIVIFGRSLGGAVASRLASRAAPRALVVESAFTSIPDMGAALYPWLPVRLIAYITYPTAKYIREVRCPVLVAHSSQDDIVPYEFGQRIFAAANEPKEFFEMSGDHNNGPWMTPDYEKRLDDFLTRQLGPARK